MTTTFVNMPNQTDDAEFVDLSVEMVDGDFDTAWFDLSGFMSEVEGCSLRGRRGYDYTKRPSPSTPESGTTKTG